MVEMAAKVDCIGWGCWKSYFFLSVVLLSGVAIKYLGENVIPIGPDNIPPYIVAAIPFFFLLIGIELAFGQKALSVGGKYDFVDSYSSIVAGTMNQICDMLTLKPFIFIIFPFSYIYQNYRICDLSFNDDDWLNWLLVFMSIDFFYYWFHRSAHEINLFWASHNVHHSSEHYNLSTALRQSAVQQWISTGFYLPVALIAPIHVIAILLQWNTLYQFWVHTTAIRRLGIIEWIMNTPSHHRVHHDRRVHANYGGTTIIWDRIFGSFVEESDGFSINKSNQTSVWSRFYCLVFSSYDSVGESKMSKIVDEKVIYGILYPSASWDLTKIQGHHFRHIFNRVAESLSSTLAVSERLKQVWSAIFIGPGYRPLMNRTFLGLGRITGHEIAKKKAGWIPPVDGARSRIRLQTDLTPTATLYHFLQFVISLGLGTVAMALQAKMPVHEQWIISFISLSGLFCQGVIFDGNALGSAYEYLRLAFWTIFGSLILASSNGNILPQEISALVKTTLHGVIPYCSSTRAFDPLMKVLVGFYGISFIVLLFNHNITRNAVLSVQVKRLGIVKYRHEKIN